MKIRFQADENLNRIIVDALLRREPTIDFKTPLAASLLGKSDPEVLISAAQAGRTLVTHDYRTMPKHFAKFIESSASPGVIIIHPKLPISTVVDDLQLIWMSTDAEDWVNRIFILPL